MISSVVEGLVDTEEEKQRQKRKDRYSLLEFEYFNHHLFIVSSGPLFRCPPVLHPVLLVGVLQEGGGQEVPPRPGGRQDVRRGPLPLLQGQRRKRQEDALLQEPFEQHLLGEALEELKNNVKDE